MNSNSPLQKKNFNRKAGRTLLIKASEPLTLIYPGQINSLQTNNNIQFIIFDTIENSLNAYKIIKENCDVQIKFAHYRIFFTINGIEENTDYNTVKNLHCEWLTANSDANILYYKLYLKNNKFIGCGEFTIDTKDSMDKLLNKDNGLKQYTFDKYSGTYYRYTKKQQDVKPYINTT
jgi:hypothetical protein